LEAQGLVNGEVRLVPYANPLGLAQQLMGQQVGRFSVADGSNFNRGYPELAARAASALQGRLGHDEAANTVLVRQALQQAAAALTARTPTEDLKRRLLQLATGCDIVLDLHCDHEAVPHLYAITAQAGMAQELGAWLGAQALLLADESGDSPFDEACCRPWLLLRQRFADHPIALATFAATVELRGQCDTSHELAERDAQAIIHFLRQRGVLAGEPAPVPTPCCQPTPLAGSEPITAPCAGVVVFHAAPGQHVQSGQLVADVIDVDSGEVLPLYAQSSGVLYARALLRWAPAGARLAKIAGTTLARTGKLLSA
jgi:hypothetical protein